MTLDSTAPADTVPVNELASYIRATRAEIGVNGLSNVTFDSGVADGDAVYLNSTDNTWYRSLAGHATHGNFHGIADVTNSNVVMWGSEDNSGWAWTAGADLYVSSATLGALTETATVLTAGVAVDTDTILVQSQLAFQDIKDEVVAARAAFGSLALHFADAEADIDDLETEVVAARGGQADVDTRIDLIETEITNARSGSLTLDARIDSVKSDSDTIGTEVTNARGSQGTLDARLDVAINEDGSLKTSVTAVSWSTVSGFASRDSTTQFTVSGLTSVFQTNRAVRANASNSYVDYVSSSATVSGNTQVTLLGRSSLPNPLTGIELAYTPYELPMHAHSFHTGIGEADDTNNNTTKDKHVSNKQMKDALDHITAAGTMSTQDANSVAITGGTISGITDLAVADGGTGASTAADARTNLGLVIGTNVLAPDGDGSSLTGVGGKPNGLINGGMEIWQRGTTVTAATSPANSDDTYCGADRWILLSDGNDIVDIAQYTTSLPDGASMSEQLTVQTANKKFGRIQILESADAKKFIGQTVSISGQFMTDTGAQVENVMLAVLAWDGAADTVTSDVVNAWGAEGAAITPVANWTLENTPAAQAVPVDAFGELKVEGISIDTAGATNIALMWWVDDTDCAGSDIIRATQLKIQVGAKVSDYPVELKADVLARCQRYFCKSYPQSVAPGTASSTAGALAAINNYGEDVTHQTWTAQALFPSTMRAAPTVVSYSPNSGATGKLYNAVGGDISVLGSTIGDAGLSFYTYGNLGGYTTIASIHYSASAEL